MALLIWFVCFSLILGVPYALYHDSQQLEQPVVVFTARSWRTVPWLLTALLFVGLLLLLAYLLATLIRPTSGLIALLCALACALIGLYLGFVMLRLYSSYWQHDRHATLTIHRQEQRAEYRNEGVFLRFALADVVQITKYTTGTGRGPLWNVYSYQIFALRDGTELLLTCLMYSMLGPQELVPTAQFETVRCHICSLPGDEWNFLLLF